MKTLMSFLVLSIVFTSMLIKGESQFCPDIFEHARISCEGTTQKQCNTAGCCWDASTSNSAVKCHRKDCKPGYFGYGCRYKCQCANNGQCDRLTGVCETGCTGDKWGIGCLLDQECTYNDQFGTQYLGKKSTTENGKTCKPWTVQMAYPDPQFPEGNKTAALNYCRNPQPTDYRTWCYYVYGTSPRDRKWHYCSLAPCDCPLGRYGVNCKDECHCKDSGEKCDQETGECDSRCALGWIGSDCQDCANGMFGTFCDEQCHCSDPDEACDTSTGKCISGCAEGWTGNNCSTECSEKSFGRNCEFTCNCADQTEDCDKVTGHCDSGCKKGYTGDGCLIAKNLTWMVFSAALSSNCRCYDPNEPSSLEGYICKNGCSTGWVGISCEIELPMMTTSPKLVNRTSESILVQWRKWQNPPDKGDGPVSEYILRFKPEQDSNWQNRRTSGLHYNIMALTFSANYIIQVIPIRENVEGLPSPDLEVDTCGIPKSEVSSLNVAVYDNRPNAKILDKSLKPSGSEEIDEGFVVVSWRMPDVDTLGCDSIVKFKVYVWDVKESNFILYGEISGITRVAISGVNDYTNYTIGVTYINSAGYESDKAQETVIGKSGPVENLVVTPSTHSIGLYWNSPLAANGPITTYLLRYRQQSVADCEAPKKSWHPILDLPSNFTSYTIPDLVPYSKYEVRIWARTAAGKGQQISKKVTTQALPPSGKVDDLTLENVTSKTGSFIWENPKCDERNGAFKGYLVKLYDTENPHVSIQVHNVNDTKISVIDLIPYQSYILKVAYVNHIDEGPMENVGFRTLEGVPPPPENLRMKLTLSDKLVVAWEAPDPPQGMITEYELKFWEGRNVDSPSFVEFNPDKTEFALENLLPNVSYGFQVRAYTKKGVGEWSPVVHGFTEETFPSRPQNLVNTSRTTDEISLSWEPPSKANGILREYKVLCAPKRAQGRYDPGQPGIVPPHANMYAVRDLSPGTEYTCSVEASTKKGFGPAIERTFFTLPREPEAPKPPSIDKSASTDTTLTLSIPHTQYVILNVESSKIIHRIVVERQNVPYNRITKRSFKPTPCNRKHNALTDYLTATREKIPCYITAQLPRLDRTHTFVVGDNTTKSGYYNAPLEKGQQYALWFGVAVTVDGITSATYTKLKEPVVAKSYVPAPGGASSNMPVVAGVIAGTILAIVLLILFLIVFVTRRKRQARQPEAATRTESEHLTSSPRASSHHEKSSTAEPFHLSTDSEGEPDEFDPLTSEKTGTLRKPIPVEHLWNYVRDKKASKSNGFKQEYEVIPQNLRAPCEYARKPENRNSNRYGNIIAYDHTRVKLENCEDLNSDYINANSIDAYRRPGAWIATQGPSKATFNDFWHMVWQERSHRIIMVTNLIEDGRHKCDQYWPETGSKAYGAITVEKLEEEQYADFTIRTFNMTKEGEDLRIVRQFHFTAWPDHGCPTYATSLIAFRKKVRSYDDPTAGPTTVHCSAGVGRTGTFIALDYLLDQAKNENFVDVYNTVHIMRTKRVNMVQTQEQYEFVYEALLEALKSGDTAISCVDFRKRYLDLLKNNPDTGKQRLAEEYELLSIMTPPVSSTGCKDAVDPENLAKNRNQDIIPLDNLARPYLMTYIPGSSDYINAVFSDGYKHRDAFIITQMPLPQTVVDFWAMCYDHECSAIVMMNELDSSDSSCACYYPVQAGSQTYGPFTIETVALDTDYPDITIRDVTLSYNKKGSEPRSVRQFQYHGWPNDQPLPLRRDPVIQLLQLIEKWQQRSGNKTIAVHCMDGATSSGLLCAISYMIERLKVEQEVDVFNSVKHTRINRPQLIPNLEQYKFIYEMAEEYMDCFGTYANFR